MCPRLGEVPGENTSHLCRELGYSVGKVLWIKGSPFMQNHHAMSYGAAEKNCFGAWGTLVQTSGGPAWPLYFIHC